MTETIWVKTIEDLENDRSYFIGKEDVLKKRRETLISLKSEVQKSPHLFKKVVSSLYKIIELSLPTTSLLSEGRRRMWQKFYLFNVSEQCKADWLPLKKFCTVQNFDALVYKLSSKILELLIKINIEALLQEEESTSPAIDREKMDDRESNIVKYVAGFISHSVTKRFKRRKDGGEKFVEALKTWSVKGRDAKCFHFKDKWINLQNRGGLVDVNDNCFLFFRTIEYSVRDVFNPKTLNNYAGENLKELLKQKIYERKYVMFRWDELMKGDVLDAVEKEYLFKVVVARWIDIRGNAFVRAWVDGLRTKYKDKVSHKGEHSHRKQLNAKSALKSKTS